MIILEIFRLDPQKYQDTTEQSRKIVALSTKAEKRVTVECTYLLKKQQKKEKGKHTHAK